MSPRDLQKKDFFYRPTGLKTFILYCLGKFKNILLQKNKKYNFLLDIF